jgi:hypothetical protein
MEVSSMIGPRERPGAGHPIRAPAGEEHIRRLIATITAVVLIVAGFAIAVRP